MEFLQFLIQLIFVFCVSVKVKLSVYCKVQTYCSIFMCLCAFCLKRPSSKWPILCWVGR